MKRTVTGRTRRSVLLVAAAAAAASLAGCSALSPDTAMKPFNPGDGVGATIGDSTVNPDINQAMVLRDMYLVKPADGTSGNLVGAVFNKTDKDLAISFSLLDASGQAISTGKMTASGSSMTKLGNTEDGAQRVQFEGVSAKPGEVLKLRAETSAGGATFSLPVILQSDDLADYGPTTASSAAASTSAEASASPSPTS